MMGNSQNRVLQYFIHCLLLLMRIRTTSKFGLKFLQYILKKLYFRIKHTNFFKFFQPKLPDYGEKVVEYVRDVCFHKTYSYLSTCRDKRAPVTCHIPQQGKIDMTYCWFYFYHSFFSFS